MSLADYSSIYECSAILCAENVKQRLISLDFCLWQAQHVCKGSCSLMLPLRHCLPGLSSSFCRSPLHSREYSSFCLLSYVRQHHQNSNFYWTSLKGKGNLPCSSLPPSKSGFDSGRKMFVVGLSEQRPLGQEGFLQRCPSGWRSCSLKSCCNSPKEGAAQSRQGCNSPVV